jgi:hypothetical protein
MNGRFADLKTVALASKRWPEWGIFARPPRRQRLAAERRFRTFPRSPRSGEARPKAVVRRARDPGRS